MQPFRHHVIVCTQQKPDQVPCCAANGGVAVLDALHSELIRQGAASDVLVSSTGCLGACEHGPIVIVYPEAVWYGAVTPADVAELVGTHLKGGQPVERLMLSDEAALRAEILEHRQRFAAMTAAREKAGVLPEPLLEQIRGFMPSRALLTALELDLFTAVDTGGSAAEIAGRMDADARATEMLLNVLVGAGLIAKGVAANRVEAFYNTPLAARLLSGASPENSRPGLLHNVHLWQSWSTLTECVRCGTAVQVSAGQRDDQSTRDFIAAMDRNARQAAVPVVAAVGQAPAAGAAFVAACPTAGGPRRLLDLGGGSAAYSIAFARANPELTAEILDQPAVVPLTREYIERAGLSGRITARVGNMLTDALGEGYDLVLLSAIAHMFSPDENRALLARICRALVPGGRLVLQDFILNADKTAPRFAAIFSLNMLVNTAGGASYSEAEYTEWLQEAGFRESKRVRLPGPANLMIATK
jgi:(2Fe-2S) ferredoxin/ubiquinone/menaquinone biosynthesis C-methylase UbiE